MSQSLETRILRTSYTCSEPSRDAHRYDIFWAEYDELLARHRSA